MRCSPGFTAASGPVTFGGVRFTTGNYVYCDEDGVVVAAERRIGEKHFGHSDALTLLET
jgi:regulator of RNase E activity RraA